MEPTLREGAHVRVVSGALRVGEIVVFQPPLNFQRCGRLGEGRLGGAACAEAEPHEGRELYVKRIVADPSDRLYIRHGHVYRAVAGHRRFQKAREPWVKSCEEECNFPTPIQVPAHRWFLMGDNRGESDDSRFWGAIPASWIVGIVAGH
jgi:signal peptidase I